MNPFSSVVRGGVVFLVAALVVVGLRALTKDGTTKRELASVTEAKRVVLEEFNTELEATLSDPAKATEIVNDLTEVYRPKLRRLERTLRFYHYGDRGPYRQMPFADSSPSKAYRMSLDAPRKTAGVTDLESEEAFQTPLELHPEEAVKYFEMKAGLLFEKGVPGGAAGPGLYAAVDPVQSQSYAGNPWILLEIEAPNGTAYMSYNELVTVPMSFYEKWFKKENESRMIKNRYSILFGTSNGAYVLPKGTGVMLSQDLLLNSPAVRKLLKAAIQSLQIDFISYAYGRPSILYCVNNGTEAAVSGIAVNFMNPELLKRGGKLSVFVASLEEHPPAEKEKRYREILDTIEMGYLLSSAGYTQSASPSPSPSSTTPVIRTREIGTLKYGFDNYGTFNEFLRSAFFFTYGWNKPLKRKSAWIPEIFPEETEVEKLATAENSHYAKRELAPKGEVKIQGLTEYQQTIQSGGSSYAAAYVVLDAEKVVEKKLGRKELERRLNRIQNFTFGCSKEQHPNEVVEHP